MGQQRAGMMSRREFIQAVGKGVGAVGLLSGAPRLAAAASLLKAPEPNPKRGGTIKTAWGITTSNFDIHQGGTAAILTQMYNNLVRKNPADGLQTIIPELAERWEVTADGLRYTFFLRPDVRFHDGTPLSADDVVATFRRIIFPPEGITSPYKDWFDAVTGVEARDAHTVQFSLHEPRPWLLEAFTAPPFVIYSHKSLAEHNNDLRKVIAPGTGPFVFKEHQVAERWLLARNPHYWNAELPYVDAIEMLHIPAWTDRGTAVLTGKADFSWNVSMETYQEGVKRRDIVGTAQLANFGAYDVQINNTRKPFDDARVRRAIHLAVSRQALMKAFETQEPINLSRWMSPASPFATPTSDLEKLPGYRADKAADIAAAKKLLAETAVPGGFKDVDLLVASVPPHAEILAPAFQDQLKRTLNIETRIRVLERALLLEEYKKGSFDMLLGTPWPFSNVADVAPMWSAMLKTGGAQNWSKYSHPEFDRLLEQLNRELDDGKRQRLVAQALDLLDQTVPYFLIGFTNHLPMWRHRVRGLAIDQRVHTEWGRFETVWLG
jgi:peptide/nickel transport system substrate-binding protein